MFTGRNTLLRDVLDFFMDYEIKSADEASKSKQQKQTEIKAIRNQFSISANKLITELQSRMAAGKVQILSYANQTGATFNNARPDFDGTLSDVDLYSALKLIIGYDAQNIKIPATHNGLGYNNLIFMSLLLAKMQVNADGSYLGSNAKIFPVLAIEEPEAHLHPAMQYKFLTFLKDNRKHRKVRQVFVTTHSTQITSAVSLDEIICLHNEAGKIKVGYPGKVFPSTEEGQNAKAYVQRFMDATKSDMLFAQRVIFVEGLAEQILLPTLAKYCCRNLEDYHIAIIPVGGRHFDHFLPLFDALNEHSIPKQIACIKDRDPERKSKSKGSFHSCQPFEFNQHTATYDYKDNVVAKMHAFSSHPNIRFFGQQHMEGKTFEYELSLCNPSSELLLTESISNKDELTELQRLYSEKKPLLDMLAEIRTSGTNSDFETAINSVTDLTWTELKKKKAVIANRYLKSVGKGENALELAYKLDKNLAQMQPDGNCAGGAEECKVFVVPEYIKNALNWVCQ
jgi:predicted ATP-dependent endonuclease of OLD family